ncbi:hypothetical protein D9M72_208620 [compost metagenome]
MVEGVTAQMTFRQRCLLQGQRRQALLHGRAAGQQAQQFRALAARVGQGVEQIEHAAALGEDRLARSMVRANGFGHGAVALQLAQVQFGVSARQVEAIHLGQLLIDQRREEHQLGAQPLQQVEVALVKESEGGIPRDADAHTGQLFSDRLQLGRGKAHRRWHGHFGAGGQGIGSGVQARVQVRQFFGLHQAQVTTGQFHVRAARQGAVPADPVRQAVADQVAVTLAADAIAEHAGKGQVRLVGGQAHGQGAEGLGHGGAIDHAEHRHAKAARQVSGRGRAVEQPHHALDQDQVGLPCRFPEQAAAFRLAHHPQVQLVDRGRGCAGEDHRVEEIRAALEHPHALALTGVQAGQGGGDGGLALAGGGSGDQQGRAAPGEVRHGMPSPRPSP